jgi:hypothetical protein
MKPKSRTFDISGVQYEVRATQDEGVWHVRCFHDGQPIGLRYSVDWTTDADFQRYHGSSAVDELMRIAENDVRNAPN